MAEDVLVRGSEARGQRLLVRILTAVVWLVAAGLFWGTQLRGGGMALGLAGLVLLVVSELVAVARRRARRWVNDTGHGLRWFGGPAEIAVADGEVTDVRLAYQELYAQGLLKAVIRRFEIWTEGRAQSLEMSTRLATGQTDPLATMIKRILDDLKARSAAALIQGVPLEGEGWVLNREGLAIGGGPLQRLFTFEQLDRSGQFDGQFCLWCKGHDEPVARINPGSRNAPILSSIIAGWLERAEQAAELQPAVEARAAGGQVSGAATPSGLGKMLFERPGRRLPALPTCLTVGLGVLGAWALVVGADRVRGGGVVAFFGVACLAAACGTLIWAFLWSRTIFRCHEEGICRRSYKGETRMRYEEMTEFSYSATRVFINGAYSGTQLAMNFRSPQTAVRYAANVKKQDANLDDLRDHIARVIAYGMVRRWLAGQSVPWTADLVLRPEGLEFRRSGFVGKKPVEVLPYAAIRAVDIQKGVFYVWNTTEQRPVLNLQVSKPNFFPGFQALLMIMQRQAEGTQGQPG